MIKRNKSLCDDCSNNTVECKSFNKNKKRKVSRTHQKKK